MDEVPTVIREIYDNENSQELFEQELERALDARCRIIVIEPNRLGDETARWIKVGNCLHKTAVLSGVSSVAVSLFSNGENCVIFVPLTALSVFCTGLYMVCWQFDPCCKYQVTRDTTILEDHKVLLMSLTSNSPAILVRKDDTARKILHTAVTLITLMVTAFRLYKCAK